MTLYHLLKRLLGSRDALDNAIVPFYGLTDASEVDIEATEAAKAVYDKYIIEECKNIVAAYESGAKVIAMKKIFPRPLRLKFPDYYGANLIDEIAEALSRYFKKVERVGDTLSVANPLSSVDYALAWLVIDKWGAVWD